MNILFSATTSIGGSLIRIGTRSDWNHVDLLFEDGTLIGATGEGVQKLTLEERLNGPHHTYAYRVDRVEVKNEELARQYAEEQVGKPYDFSAIFAFLIPWRADWNADDRWFCSELVASVIEKGGTKITRENMYRVTPGYLDTSPLLETIVPVVKR